MIKLTCFDPGLPYLAIELYGTRTIFNVSGLTFDGRPFSSVDNQQRHRIIIYIPVSKSKLALLLHKRSKARAGIIQMTSFTDKPSEITKQEWLEKLENVHLQRTDMNRLVMNYLVTGKNLLFTRIHSMFSVIWILHRGFQRSSWKICFGSWFQGASRTGKVGWKDQNSRCHSSRKDSRSHSLGEPAASRFTWFR